MLLDIYIVYLVNPTIPEILCSLLFRHIFSRIELRISPPTTPIYRLNGFTINLKSHTFTIKITPTSNSIHDVYQPVIIS